MSEYYLSEIIQTFSVQVCIRLQAVSYKATSVCCAPISGLYEASIQLRLFPRVPARGTRSEAYFHMK
jgi:hypothetical protein